MVIFPTLPVIVRTSATLCCPTPGHHPPSALRQSRLTQMGSITVLMYVLDYEKCHLIVIHVSCVCFVSYTILCKRPSWRYSGLGPERTKASYLLSALSDVRNTEHLYRRTDIAAVLYVKGTSGSVADSHTSPFPPKELKGGRVRHIKISTVLKLYI